MRGRRRRRGGCGRRRRRRRGGRCGRRRRKRPVGQEDERIDVAVRILRTPDAQMNVRHVVLQGAARTDGGDRRSFTHRVTPLRSRRAEMRQRHRVAVASLNRQRPTADRHRACERDNPRDRRQHRGSRGSADVDTAVLAGRVGVITELELLHHRPVGRPRPCCGGRREHEHGCDGRDQSSAHLGLLVFLVDNTQAP